MGIPKTSKKKTSKQNSSNSRGDLYRDLFEHTADAILLIDGGKFVDCNAAAVEMLRAKNKKMVLQTHPSQLSPQFQFDGKASFEKANEMIDLAIKKGNHRFEWLHKRLNGEIFPVEVLLTSLVQSTGRSILHVVWRDISERKAVQSALLESEEKLRQSQKMEAVGQLAGGIAHDFNNMLAGIIGAAEILRVRAKNPKMVEKFAVMILDTAEHAAELIDKLLNFSRQSPMRFQPLDLEKVTKTAIQLLQRSIDRRIEILTRWEATRSIVIGDMAQLQNAALNLGINARDAMPNGGTLTFYARNIYLHQPTKEYWPQGLKPGNYIVLEITDTGVGMSDEIKHRIFDPFFTTKEAGKGTGLGLASVYGLIKKHQGLIEVKSSPGEGSVFSIYLPVADDVPVPRLKKNGSLFLGSGTVLFIDDESFFRETGCALLEELGYNVDTARDGKEGLKKFQDNPSKYCLILVDMIMPKMGGQECVLEIRKIDQRIPIIMCSGYTQGIAIDQLLSGGVTAFIKKPFRRKELCELLSQNPHPDAEENLFGDGI